MAAPVVLQGAYDLGFRQDETRARVPEGAVWNLVDFVPELDAPLGKRGGWSYASPALDGVVAGIDYVYGVAYAPFSGGAQLLAFAQKSGDPRLVKVTSSSSATNVGVIQVPLQHPVMHNDKLIITNNDGSTTPKYYDGTTLANLPGSTPAGKYATIFKDRTLISGVAAAKNKVYFSQASDANTTWDTTNSYITVSEEVKGMASLPNAALIFMPDRAARLRGSIPPAQGGALGSSDMILDDPIFNQGCIDARSIAVFGGYAVFANANGIYLTNGSNQPEDLTAAVGLKRYWTSLLSGYVAANDIVSAGIYQNEYWISYVSSLASVDLIVIDLSKRRARRVSNVPAISFAQTGAVTGDKFYFASVSQPRVGDLSTTFTQTSTYKNDANGTAVTPILETGMFRGKPGQKRFRWGYLDFDLKDASSDNPVLTLSYLTDPQGSYTALGSTVAETTALNQVRFPLRFKDQGFALKVAQTNASARTHLYEISVDAHRMEGSRLPSGGKALAA